MDGEKDASAAILCWHGNMGVTHIDLKQKTQMCRHKRVLKYTHVDEPDFYRQWRVQYIDMQPESLQWLSHWSLTDAAFSSVFKVLRVNKFKLHYKTLPSVPCACQYTFCPHPSINVMPRIMSE